jgi:hypothetical protein
MLKNKNCPCRLNRLQEHLLPQLAILSFKKLAAPGTVSASDAVAASETVAALDTIAASETVKALRTITITAKTDAKTDAKTEANSNAQAISRRNILTLTIRLRHPASIEIADFQFLKILFEISHYWYLQLIVFLPCNML